MAVASLGISAKADHTFRWHRYADNSMLRDDDEYGQRLIMPQEVQAADLLKKCDTHPDEPIDEH